MKAKKARRALAYEAEAHTAAGATKATAFTFGDPVPVLNRADILDYAELATLNGWYEPPVSWAGLAKSFRAGTHHASALYFKRNILASTFIPHKCVFRRT